MGRRSEGWKLREPRDACGNYTVRFRWDGVDYDRSTGTADPERAAIEAARIYARVISTPRPGRKRERPAGELEGALAEWLDSLRATLDPGTVTSYADYAESHWMPFFAGMHNLTSLQADAYMRKRLTQVVAKTVKKELSALRGFIRWATRRGLLPPVEVPSVPEKATGTPYKKRRRAAAVPLSEAEVKAIIRALPEWSTSKKVPPFPVRARFLAQYETGLRSELFDLLSVPEHYATGATELNITPDLDKGRWSRRVPISNAAQRALDKVCPESGLIFGAHDYRTHVKRAAEKALPPERARLFTGAHLRSARATHWLDKSAPLTGVQFLLGHKRLETTARYVRAHEKAAKGIVRKR
jgi:integrase